MYGRMNAGTGVTFNGLGAAMAGPETLEPRARQEWGKVPPGGHRILKGVQGASTELVRRVSALARLQRQWGCERLCLQRQ